MNKKENPMMYSIKTHTVNILVQEIVKIAVSVNIVKTFMIFPLLKKCLKMIMNPINRKIKAKNKLNNKKNNKNDLKNKFLKILKNFFQYLKRLMDLSISIKEEAINSTKIQVRVKI